MRIITIVMFFIFIGCSTPAVKSKEICYIDPKSESSEITKGNFSMAICGNEVLIYLEKINQGDRTLYLDSYGRWRQYMDECEDVEDITSESL